MSVLKSVVFAVVCLVTFFNVCFTSFQLAEMLSSQIPWQVIRPVHLVMKNLLQQFLLPAMGKISFHVQPLELMEKHAFLVPLLYDMLLVLLFVAQHSIMATDWWKDILDDFGLRHITRSIYCFATSVALQSLMFNWRPLPATPLWWINTQDSNALWLFFFLIHMVAWVLIYSAALTMDFAELTGMKQVYYYMQGWEEPMSYKSRDAQRLYGHMRHPGAWCFLVVLWLHPLMTLGRFVLALMWTMYLLFGHTVDEEDYEYVEVQVTRKRFEIDRRLEVLE